MSDAFQELADLPKDFVKDGMLFVNRCTKRMSFRLVRYLAIEAGWMIRSLLTTLTIADKREFLKISQAVGFGFLIMGAIGYFIKLSEFASLL